MILEQIEAAYGPDHALRDDEKLKEWLMANQYEPLYSLLFPNGHLR